MLGVHLPNAMYDFQVVISLRQFIKEANFISHLTVIQTKNLHLPRINIVQIDFW